MQNNQQTFPFKEEFLEKYRNMDHSEEETNEHYVCDISELEKAVLEDDIDSLMKLNRLIDYHSEIDNNVTIRVYDDSSIKSSNLVILACKHNKIKSVEYLLSDDCEILNNLSKCMHKPIISPFDKDETCHNAFYYAIRSSNVELLNLLIDKWPDNYFGTHKDELDKILSVTFEELKLKNVLLSSEVEMFVQKKLLEVRFFSDENDESFSSDVNNIKERIEIVLDSIDSLVKEYSDNSKVDQKFLFIVKFIAQNIHILKWQLKSTYDRLPWEEIEFCLLGFISFHIKKSEMNLFYQSLLDECKVINYLNLFSEKLIKEKCSILKGDKLSVLPRLKREKIVENIISSCPQFEPLYKDYQKMRDMYSLERINNYIHLALSADLNKSEGRLVIARTLQITGENIKNTLESPNLSNGTSELLLMSLPKHTKQIITSLRDSLSHAHSLSERMDVEENEHFNFYFLIQNDLIKVGEVIADILCSNKTKLVTTLLEKIICSENIYEIKEVFKILNNVPFVAINTEILRTAEHRLLEKYVEKLCDKINDKTCLEEVLFQEINNLIKLKKKKLKNMFDNFSRGLLTLMVLNSLVCEFGCNDVSQMKFSARKALNDMKPIRKSYNVEEVTGLAHNVLDSITPRMENEYDKFGEVNDLFYGIICLAEYIEHDVKWIQIFREKLRSKSYFNFTHKQNDTSEEQLQLKISELKSIINNNTETFSLYINNKLLHATLEMLVLDIMSILDSSGNLLQNITLFDECTPLLSGKTLRNYLAHDNALFDVLCCDPPVVIITIAKLLTENMITGGKIKLGKPVKDDLVNLKNKYNHSLSIINDQMEMFVALENGNMESLRACIKNGADFYAMDITLLSTFHFAAKGCSLDIIKFIFDQNYDLVTKDRNGQSPLHIAAANGRNDIVQLFGNKIKINDSDNGGKTALHVAAQNGFKDVVESLLTNKACKNIYDNRTFLPIHYAISNNHSDVADVLLMKELREIEKLGLLHSAAESGHLEIVNLLLKNNVNVNARHDKQQVPLHAAVDNGHLKIVDALIIKGALVNAEDWSGCTPLHYAVKFDYYDIVKMLLENGACVNVFDKMNGNTALQIAAIYGHHRIVKILLENNANVDAASFYKSTPLHFAAVNNNKEIAELLIAYRANINARDTYNYTPLHSSAFSGHFDFVKLLLEEKADVTIEDYKGNTPLYLATENGYRNIVDLLIKNQAVVNAKTYNRDTPLHAAAQNGHESIVRLLIDEGSEVNSANNDGVTPLFTAIRGGNINIFNILLKNNAKIDVKSNNEDTPLHVAVKMGNKEMVEYLIGSENINAKNKYNETPFFLALKYGDVKIVDLFLAKGADVNENHGLPLLGAIFFGHVDIVKLLLNRNAYVNFKDHCFTPLHFAAGRGHTEIVRVLVNHKRVNVNAEINGITALHIAALEGFDEIVKHLTKFKAKVNACSKYGTALHLAAKRGKSNVVKVLLNSGADVNIVDEDSKTALVLAVENDHLCVIKLLWGKYETVENLKMLNIACDRGNLDMVKYLTSNGSDINASESGKKPIHIAVKRGFIHIVDFFISEGVSINDCDPTNQTLLHYAAEEDNLEMIKYLINKGADINAVCDNGSTPLHIAAQFGSKDIVEYFLDRGSVYDIHNKYNIKPSDKANDRNSITFVSTNNMFTSIKNNNGIEIEKHIKVGACVNAKNSDFETPLHIATREGCNKVVQVLLEHGANPNVSDKNGFTSLHYAAKNSHFEVVVALLQSGAVYNSVCNNGSTPSDLSTDKNIIELFKLVNDAFENVKNDNSYVIHDIKSKNINIVKAVMCSHSKQNETLLVLAIRNNFSNVKELKEVLQDSVSEQIEKSLSFCYQGKYKESISILNCVLKKREEIFGSDNPGTLDILDHIAKVLVKQGVYEEAFSILEKVFNKRKESLGPMDKDTLNTRGTIALIYHKKGEYENAHSIYKEIYEKQRLILWQNHPDVIDTQFHMALTLDEKGEYEDALKIMVEVFKEWKETLGENNNVTMSAENNMAKVLSNLGRNEEALTMSQSVYARQINILGVNHPDTLLTLHNIASILASQRKYNKALEKYEEVLSLQRNVLGENHPDTVLSECKMASLLSIRHDQTIAYIALKKCYDKRDILGLSHPIIQYIGNKINKIDSNVKKEEGFKMRVFTSHIQENFNRARNSGDEQLVQYLSKCGAVVGGISSPILELTLYI